MVWLSPLFKTCLLSAVAVAVLLVILVAVVEVAVPLLLLLLFQLGLVLLSLLVRVVHHIILLLLLHQALLAPLRSPPTLVGTHTVQVVGTGLVTQVTETLVVFKTALRLEAVLVLVEQVRTPLVRLLVVMVVQELTVTVAVAAGAIATAIHFFLTQITELQQRLDQQTLDKAEAELMTNSVDYLVVQDTHNLDTTDRKHGTFCTTRKQHSHQSHRHWERRH
jgi:hypothetical protein